MLPTILLHSIFLRDDASGTEDGAIALDVSSALTDIDGSESLSVTISGVPTGASLSAGTDNGNGTWTLTQGQLSGLTITPAADSDADFTLTVTATSTDGDDTASVGDTIDVTVDAVADAPTLAAADASGTEDGAIALDVSSALTDIDGSESLSVTISGVPTGASLSAGTDNGNGTWTLTQGQLSGLTITPAADSDADFTLTVTATATDHADTYGGKGNDALDGGAGNDRLYGHSRHDWLFGGEGNDQVWGGNGSDTFVFTEGDGTDVFHGGTGGGWTDVLELRDPAGGGAPSESWFLEITRGEQVSSSTDHIDLSQDAAGTITMEDGSVPTFDGVEKLTW